MNDPSWVCEYYIYSVWLSYHVKRFACVANDVIITSIYVYTDWGTRAFKIFRTRWWCRILPSFWQDRPCGALAHVDLSGHSCPRPLREGHALFEHLRGILCRQGGQRDGKTGEYLSCNLLFWGFFLPFLLFSRNAWHGFPSIVR